MTSLFLLAGQLQEFLKSQNWRFCFIGGIIFLVLNVLANLIFIQPYSVNTVTLGPIAYTSFLPLVIFPF